MVVANLADSTKDKRRQDEARQGETRPAETQPSSLGTVDRPCYWHSNGCPIEWQSINNNGNPMPDAGSCRQQFWARFPPPKTHRTRQSSQCLVLSLMQTLPLVPPSHPPLGKTTNQSKEEKETQKKSVKMQATKFLWFAALVSLISLSFSSPLFSLSPFFLLFFLVAIKMK